MNPFSPKAFVQTRIRARSEGYIILRRSERICWAMPKRDAKERCQREGNKKWARRLKGRRAHFFKDLQGKICKSEKITKPHTSAHSDGTFGTTYRVRWWGRQNSNLWPLACQASALTNWATPPWTTAIILKIHALVKHSAPIMKDFFAEKLFFFTNFQNDALKSFFEGINAIYCVTWFGVGNCGMALWGRAFSEA